MNLFDIFESEDDLFADSAKAKILVIIQDYIDFCEMYIERGRNSKDNTWSKEEIESKELGIENAKLLRQALIQGGVEAAAKEWHRLFYAKAYSGALGAAEMADEGLHIMYAIKDKAGVDFLKLSNVIDESDDMFAEENPNKRLARIMWKDGYHLGSLSVANIRAELERYPELADKITAYNGGNDAANMWDVFDDIIYEFEELEQRKRSLGESEDDMFATKKKSDLTKVNTANLISLLQTLDVGDEPHNKGIATKLKIELKRRGVLLPYGIEDIDESDDDMFAKKQQADLTKISTPKLIEFLHLYKQYPELKSDSTRLKVELKRRGAQIPYGFDDIDESEDDMFAPGKFQKWTQAVKSVLDDLYEFESENYNQQRDDYHLTKIGELMSDYDFLRSELARGGIKGFLNGLDSVGQDVINVIDSMLAIKQRINLSDIEKAFYPENFNESEDEMFAAVPMSSVLEWYKKLDELCDETGHNADEMLRFDSDTWSNIYANVEDSLNPASVVSMANPQQRLQIIQDIKEFIQEIQSESGINESEDDMFSDNRVVVNPRVLSKITKTLARKLEEYVNTIPAGDTAETYLDDAAVLTRASIAFESGLRAGFKELEGIEDISTWEYLEDLANKQNIDLSELADRYDAGELSESDDDMFAEPDRFKLSELAEIYCHRYQDLMYDAIDENDRDEYETAYEDFDAMIGAFKVSMEAGMAILNQMENGDAFSEFAEEAEDTLGIDLGGYLNEDDDMFADRGWTTLTEFGFTEHDFDELINMGFQFGEGSQDLGILNNYLEQGKEAGAWWGNAQAQKIRLHPGGEDECQVLIQRDLSINEEDDDMFSPRIEVPSYYKKYIGKPVIGTARVIRDLNSYWDWGDEWQIDEPSELPPIWRKFYNTAGQTVPVIELDGSMAVIYVGVGLPIRITQRFLRDIRVDDPSAVYESDDMFAERWYDDTQVQNMIKKHFTPTLGFHPAIDLGLEWVNIVTDPGDFSRTEMLNANNDFAEEHNFPFRFTDYKWDGNEGEVYWTLTGAIPSLKEAEDDMFSSAFRVERDVMEWQEKAAENFEGYERPRGMHSIKADGIVYLYVLQKDARARCTGVYYSPQPATEETNIGTYNLKFQGGFEDYLAQDPHNPANKVNEESDDDMFATGTMRKMPEIIQDFAYQAEKMIERPDEVVAGDFGWTSDSDEEFDLWIEECQNAGAMLHGVVEALKKGGLPAGFQLLRQMSNSDNSIASEAAHMALSEMEDIYGINPNDYLSEADEMFSKSPNATVKLGDAIVNFGLGWIDFAEELPTDDEENKIYKKGIRERGNDFVRAGNAFRRGMQSGIMSWVLVDRADREQFYAHCREAKGWDPEEYITSFLSESV